MKHKSFYTKGERKWNNNKSNKNKERQFNQPNKQIAIELKLNL